MDTFPIIDQDGMERVHKGKYADEGMLPGMGLFVEGVAGSIPE